MQKFLILLLAIFTIQSSIFAQERKVDTIPETKLEKKQAKKKNYSLGQFAHESYLFIKEPATWKGSDWLVVGAVTAGTVSIMTLDKTTRNLTQGQQHYYYSIPIVGGRVYGEWYSIGGVAGVFGLVGWIARDTAALKVSIELLQAGLYSELITTLLKIGIGRARPISGESAFTYKPFTFFNDNYHSMPSGHTTSAVALSTVMSRHAHTIVLKIIAYVPAAFTMFSRMYQDKHWLSDIVPAAAIGYFAGNWVVDLHEGKYHRIKVTALYPVAISFDLDRQLTQK